MREFAWVRGCVRHGASALVLAWALSATAAFAGDMQHMPMKKAIAAPDGFADVCRRYDWACASGKAGSQDEGALLALAGKVNLAVNRAYRQVSDARQYGVEEFWALPTKARGGDCEDFALAKKLRLIKSGVAPGQLLLATVLDRKNAFHAVLVLRTASGDYVLDNLKNGIRRWEATGYSFLRMQDPKAPSRWTAVFAGGAFG